MAISPEDQPSENPIVLNADRRWTLSPVQKTEYIQRRRKYVQTFSPGAHPKDGGVHLPVGERMEDKRTMAGYGDVLCGGTGLYIGPAEEELMIEIADCEECRALYTPNAP